MNDFGFSYQRPVTLNSHVEEYALFLEKYSLYALFSSTIICLLKFDPSVKFQMIKKVHSGKLRMHLLFEMMRKKVKT